MSNIMRISDALEQHLPAFRGQQLPALRVRTYSAAALPPGLPYSVREAALLLCGDEVQQVRQMSSLELAAELTAPIEGVPLMLGHSKTLHEDDDLEMLCKLTAEMVHRSFPGLTLAEIGLAFRRGASGEWKQPGEVLLPTVQCFRSWLSAYQKGDRVAAVQALQKGEAGREQLLLPAPDVASTYPQQLVHLAAYMKQHGRAPEPFDAGFLLYDWLKKLGAFVPFKTNAELYLMLRKESIKQAASAAAEQQQRKKIQTFGEVLRRGFPGGHPLANSVKNACKKRLLREWIYYHNARGTNYLTLLEQLQTPAAGQHQAAA
jgi:hypothetical protein